MSDVLPYAQRVTDSLIADLPERDFLDKAWSVAQAVNSASMDDVNFLLDTAFQETIIGPIFALGQAIHGQDGEAMDLRKSTDFRQYDYVPEELVLEHGRRYMFADSLGEIGEVTRSIKQDRDRASTLANYGPIGAAAQVAGGLLDPIAWLIPIGASAKVMRAASIVGKPVSILDNAATAALWTAGTELPAEIARQINDSQRTYGEGVWNVAGSTALSGILGGTLAKLSTDRVDSLIAAIEGDMADIDGKHFEQFVTSMSSVGAAQTRATNLVAEGLARPESEIGNKVFQGFLSVVGQQDPSLRMMRNESLQARIAGQMMAENPNTLAKNQMGVATELSAEAMARYWQGNLYRSKVAYRDEYIRYYDGSERKYGDIAKSELSFIANRQQAGRKLSFGEFRTEIGKAMRRGDQHEISEVAASAKKLRSELYEPMFKEAQDLGIFEGDIDVKTALSYLNRQYNKNMMADVMPSARFGGKSPRQAFEDTTVDWLRGKHTELREQLQAQIDDALAKADTKSAKDAAKLQKEMDELPTDDLDLRDMAQMIMHRIEGAPAGRLSYEMTLPVNQKLFRPSGAGVTKERVFNIPDHLIEDFLESDVEVLASSYAHSLGADIAIIKNFGDMELTDAILKIRDDFEQLAKKQPTKDWDKQRKQAEEDLLAMRDRIRGLYGVPRNPAAYSVRAARAARQLSYVTMLGGMTLASLPDMANIVMKFGIDGVTNDLLRPMIKNFSEIKRVTQDVRDMGAATDLINNARAASLAGFEDNYVGHSKLERGLSGVANSFAQVALMSQWNFALKSLVGMTAQTRMIRDIEAVATAKSLSDVKAASTRLNAASISDQDAMAIYQLLQEHGGEVGGVKLSNWLEWDRSTAYKRELHQKWDAALKREVNATILTPGMDRPLWTDSTELGKLVSQFKNHAFASTQRIAISGLQRQDRHALNGLMLSIFLGSLSYGLKGTIDGRPLSDDPKQWIVEGFDRSGAFGWIFEANNILDKLTQGNISISSAIGAETPSRYYQRSTLSSVAGPGASVVESLADVVGAVTGDGATPQSIRAARKLIPYQNIFYARWMLDSVQDAMNQALGTGAAQ